MTTIQILSRIDGTPTEYDGGFVSAYDPTAHEPDGSYIGGILETVSDPAWALHFENIASALIFAKRTPGCACHNTRPWDGKPNRPLTQFNLLFETLP